MASTEDGWEVPKRRRQRKAPAVPRSAIKGGNGRVDGRGREEVLGEFERNWKKWRGEWEALPCRENLGRAMGRVRAGLGIEGGPSVKASLGGSLEEGMKSMSIDEGAGRISSAPDSKRERPPANGDQEGGKVPRWPRRASGLSCAVCLGLGSFEDEGWEVVRRSWIQYFAFLAIVEALDPSLPVIFQEPEFTPGDKTFLESRGHAVVDDPLGFDVIAADPGGCVVVGFHLYVPIYMRALGEGRVLPRVFIGTAWDVWDEINKGEELPTLRRMHETYKSEAFPQDHMLSTFSSTNIYWLPNGSEAPRGEGKPEVSQVGKESARQAPAPLGEGERLPPN